MTETLTRSDGMTRAARALLDSDLSRRVGRVSDLIGLIIEATGVQVEIGEVCMVGGGRDAVGGILFRPRSSASAAGARC